MYYVIKTEHRPDGVINVSQVGRQSFATGLAEFFAQCSKAAGNANFISSDIALTDDTLELVRPVEHIAGAAEEG